jgi:hypothetical protein
VAVSRCLALAGTPLWKLVLKQFDDLLVKVRHDTPWGQQQALKTV